MIMQDVQIAINEDDLAALSFEIDDYVDRISTIFEKYNTKISNLSNYYKGQSCEKILSYYGNIKKNFPIVKKNIKNYGEDYRDLIKILNSSEKKLVEIFDEKTIETTEKVKKQEETNTEEINKRKNNNIDNNLMSMINNKFNWCQIL